MTKLSGRAAHQGFTLLELLVAISLMSLVLLILYGGLHLGSRSWDTIDTHATQSEERRLVHDLVRRRLIQAVPFLQRINGKWEMRFEGTPHSLRFVAELAPRFGQGGFREVFFGPNATDSGLIIKSQLLHPDLAREVPTDAVFESVLVDDELTFEFSYFGTKRREKPRWYDSWDEPRAIPTLVRVSALRRDYTVWPVLDVALPTSAKRFDLRTPSNEDDAPDDWDDADEADEP